MTDEVKAQNLAEHFPSFFGGAFIEASWIRPILTAIFRFLRFLAETFIEVNLHEFLRFSTGQRFPFLFGGAFNKTD